jgi:undecaprenyl-diphosphatase
MTAMSEVVVDRLIKLDTLILFKIVRWDVNSLIRRLFYGISRSADGYLYVLYALLLIVYCHSGTKLFFALLSAFTINLSVYFFLKNFIKRKRPYERNENIQNLIKPPDKYSFPSGHTAGAFLVAGIIGFQFPHLQEVLYLWATLVGLSRIFLCVHYPTDVLAGFILGSAASRLGIEFFF